MFADYRITVTGSICICLVIFEELKIYFSKYPLLGGMWKTQELRRQGIAFPCTQCGNWLWWTALKCNHWPWSLTDFFGLSSVSISCWGTLDLSPLSLLSSCILDLPILPWAFPLGGSQEFLLSSPSINLFFRCLFSGLHVKGNNPFVGQINQGVIRFHVNCNFKSDTRENFWY